MEIWQPSNLFSNLAFLAIRCCQINALKVMIPDLEPPDNPLPNYSVDLGGGYVLLRACDRYNYCLGEIETQLIREFVDGPVPKFKRWARLRLPNGQVTINDRNEIAQVLYYAQLTIKADDINDNKNDGELEYHDDEIYRFVTVAMVSVYSHPDPELLQKSMQTVWSCKYHGNEALQLVSVKSIHGKGSLFLLEKPGLRLVTVDEEVEDEADEDE
ncbi:hypothetical protein EV424DRAFT_1350322 [Suillus variegatus]|nr:hypothetical protein EV424DRAFT_1350322 [Suillus variegatus]